LNIIVQKFGGSSVTTSELREKAVDKIIRAKSKGCLPVVVVSAMGRGGAPYATDTLLGLVKPIYPDLSKRETDLLLSCGELISAVVFAATLESKGCSAVVLTGGQAGIITDDNFANAKIIQVNPKTILNYLREGKIVVVAGFQGITKRGDVTTLGRGGSDTTAAALGVALDAVEIEIYTDVEGIMTADPRIVPEAKILEVVTYHEICEMALQGAKIIHPRAVEIAMEKAIPLRVKCTFSDAAGTLITGSDNDKTRINNDRIITGVSYIPNVVQIRIDIPSPKLKPEIELKVFKLLAEHSISVDLFNILNETIIFTVQESSAREAVKLLTEGGFDLKIKENCAKVSVVGAGMRGIPGVMAKIIEALNKAGVSILQTADSHTTISCLVNMSDLNNAVIALHGGFGLAS
jgi:aspartate kinase